MKEGAEILTAKIQRYRPKIAVFNGKGYLLYHYVYYCNLCLIIHTSTE